MTENKESAKRGMEDIEFDPEEMDPGNLGRIQMDFLEGHLSDVNAWGESLSLLMNKPDVKVGQTPSETIFEDGMAELLHYKPKKGKEKDRPTLLLVYALINEPYILDLQPGRSVVESLLNEGIDVYMINWGSPDERELFNTLDDFVNYYIGVCVDQVRKDSGKDSINILGYCMGGTMSTMYTALHPEKIKSLVLMAAGIDFKNDPGMLRQWADKEYFDPEKVVEAYNCCPAEFLDGAYLWMDPVGNTYSKFKNLAHNTDQRKFVEMFFRMEKWIHDGKDLPGPTFSKFVKELYQENKLINNELRVGGELVNLENIDMPLLTLVGEYDTLVPPESSLTINEKMKSKDTKVMKAPVGHIGLSVSSKSHSGLWPEVAEWLKKKDNPLISEVKGVGNKFAEKLTEAGIETVKDLREYPEEDIPELSEKTGISEKRLKTWKERC